MSNRKRDTRPYCQWTQDEDGNWDTACDEKYVFIDGGPKENGCKFCMYCGALIRCEPAPTEERG